MLFSVFFSPGTGRTSALIVTGWPIGGDSPSLTATVVSVPACVWSMTSLGPDRVAGAADPHANAHVLLGVLALVGDLDG